MRRRLLLLAVLLAAALPLAVASAASACSYAVPPDLTRAELDRQLLRGSDAAFVGRLVAIVPLGEAGAQPPGRGAYLFRIAQKVKGDLPFRWVVVRATIGGSACGLEVRIGDRTGLMLDRTRRGWTSHLLLQLSPRQLIRAAAHPAD